MLLIDCNVIFELLQFGFGTGDRWRRRRCSNHNMSIPLRLRRAEVCHQSLTKSIRAVCLSPSQPQLRVQPIDLVPVTMSITTFASGQVANILLERDMKANKVE